MIIAIFIYLSKYTKLKKIAQIYKISVQNIVTISVNKQNKISCGVINQRIFPEAYV